MYKHPGDDNDSPLSYVSTNVTVPTERRSGRRKLPNKRYLSEIESQEGEEQEISPLCVGCNVYVDRGVFCTECQGWWHYTCAHTSKSAVKKLRGREFVCSADHKLKQSDLPTDIVTPFENHGVLMEGDSISLPVDASISEKQEGDVRFSM